MLCGSQSFIYRGSSCYGSVEKYKTGTDTSFVPNLESNTDLYQLKTD